MTLEEYVSHADKNEKLQNAFATTEFGFDIWVPFAKQWQQTLVDGAMTADSNKWTVAPKSLGAQGINDVAKDWAPIFNLFRDNFDEAYKAYPNSQARAKSVEMADELAEILYDGQKIPTVDAGVSRYKNTKGETKDYLVMEYLATDEYDDIEGPAKLYSTEAGEGFSTLSSKSIDFMAETDQDVINLGYVLHRLANQEGVKKGFVEGIQGIEVTTETTTKYFSQAYNAIDNIEDPQERLEQAAKNIAKELMQEYNKVGGNLTKVYNQWAGATKDGKNETAQYIGAQILDRFWEVTERMFRQTDGAKVGGAYLYQIPLHGSQFKLKRKIWPLIGFIRIEPVWKKNPAGKNPNYGDLILDKIATQALAIDMGSVAGRSIEEIDALIGKMKGARGFESYIGVLSNFLIWDAHFNLGVSHAEAITLMKDIDTQMANITVLTSNRADLIGSSLWVYTQGGIDILSPKPFVQAVKTLTTPEIAESLREQFEIFLSPNSPAGKAMAKKYAQFYEAAVSKSQDITKIWIKNIKYSWSNWQGVKNSAFGKSWGYKGGKSPAGQGAAGAWFLNYNRDPNGWEEFKEKTSIGPVQYVLKLLGGETSAKGQMDAYKNAVPVVAPEGQIPMISEGGQIRPATEAEYHARFHPVRWADESTLGQAGEVTEATDIFAHGGYRMGGGVATQKQQSGGVNPFLLQTGQRQSPFFSLSSQGKKVK